MSRVVPIRLDDKKYTLYAEQAALSGKGLSTHLKQRLELGDHLIATHESVIRKLNDLECDVQRLVIDWSPD